MGITNKKIDFYGYVGNSKYFIEVKCPGSKDKIIKPTPETEKLTDTLGFFDISWREHTGRFQFDIFQNIRNSQKICNKYAEVAPTTGNLADSNMKVMLKTKSEVNSKYAYSYGFYDAGTGKAHQCYAYVTESYKTWMADILDQKPSNLEVPLSTFCLPGSHDAGMYAFEVPASLIASNLVTWILPKLDDPETSVWLKVFMAVLEEASGMAHRIIQNIAFTQKDNIDTQLELGVRYFDFRAGHHVWDSESELYHQHKVIPGCSLKKFLQQVKSFLLSNPKEIVVTSFSTDGFEDSKTMNPRGEEINDMLKDVFNEDISIGDFSDYRRPYGNLLKENKRFIRIDKDLKSTWNEAAHSSLDPATIVKHLSDLSINKDKGYCVQLQGTASTVDGEVLKAVLSFSDASSILLSTKPRFDEALYPWIAKNYSSFPNDQPLVFLNDFVDNHLVEKCHNITLSRIKLHEKGKHDHESYGVSNGWVNVYGDKTYIGKVPYDYNYNNIHDIYNINKGEYTCNPLKTIGVTSQDSVNKSNDESIYTARITNNSSTRRYIRTLNHIVKEKARKQPYNRETLIEVGTTETIEVSVRNPTITIVTKVDKSVKHSGEISRELSCSPMPNVDLRKRELAILKSPGCTPNIYNEDMKVLTQSQWWFSLSSHNNRDEDEHSNLNKKDQYTVDFEINKLNIIKKCRCTEVPHRINADLEFHIEIKKLK